MKLGYLWLCCRRRQHNSHVITLRIYCAQERGKFDEVCSLFAAIRDGFLRNLWSKWSHGGIRYFPQYLRDQCYVFFYKTPQQWAWIGIAFSQVFFAVVRLNDLPKSEYLCPKFPVFLICFAGVCHTKPALVSGGRIFVWPWIQKLQKWVKEIHAVYSRYTYHNRILLRWSDLCNAKNANVMSGLKVKKM